MSTLRNKEEWPSEVCYFLDAGLTFLYRLSADSEAVFNKNHTGLPFPVIILLSERAGPVRLLERTKKDDPRRPWEAK